MRMSPMTIPLIALLAVVGTGGGVILGKSAIGEIDPVHFSAASGSRFYADMVPGNSKIDDLPPTTAAMRFGASDYGTGGPLMKQAIPDYPVDYVPTLDPAITELSETVTVTEVAAATTQGTVISTPDPDAARLAAYSSFPITEPAVLNEGEAEPIEEDTPS